MSERPPDPPLQEPPHSMPSKRIGAAGFLAENLLVLGFLLVLLGIFYGSCVLSYGFHWLVAAVPFAIGVSLVGLAWRVRRKPLSRNDEPGDGSND